MEFRTGYNYDRDAVSRETGLACDPDEQVTQVQFAKDCDINEIVRRFGLTGQLPVSAKIPLSGEFAEVSDFHTAMNLVVQAESEFMKLPGEVRARFQHDVGALMAFLEDPSNREEAVKLGLVTAPAEVARDGSALPG